MSLKHKIMAYVADVLYTLGLVRVWEWVYDLKMPVDIKLTWIWEAQNDNQECTDK